MKYSIKDLVRDGKVATFRRYRKGELIYAVPIDEDGELEFPVPVEDAGDGVFHSAEKAMLLMRYIRKHLESMETEQDKMQEQAAIRFYYKWIDAQNIHCNRFPSWGELPETEREIWRAKAARA